VWIAGEERWGGAVPRGGAAGGGSGSGIQGSKRHRIPDPDPQHCTRIIVLLIVGDERWGGAVPRGGAAGGGRGGEHRHHRGR
jgi:hypothetical protein